MTAITSTHSLIGFDPTFDTKLLVTQLVKEFRGEVDWPVRHKDRLQCAAELVYTHHLGLARLPAISEFVDGGLDTAVDYFLGSPREEDERNDIWYEPLRDGLMLGMLAARWDDVARLCSWLRADLVPEYCGPIEYQIPQLYILMGGSLRREALEGSNELEASIAKARTKRPRELLKAWQAARNGDQADFDAATKQSLKSFASKPALPPDDTYIGERIARPETAVCLAAMHLGLRFPDLPAELAARLVTRESLGLES